LRFFFEEELLLPQALWLEEALLSLLFQRINILALCSCGSVWLSG